MIEALRDRGLWPERQTSSGIRHPTLGEPHTIWTYRGADGRTLGHVCRWETAQGKDIRPWVNGRWKHFEKPRPLYGLDRLARNPDAPVIVCEGEKAADAAQRIMGAGYVAVTWPGGTNSARHADWSPLQGREVRVWPDADAPGRKAARAIARQIPGARIIEPPADKGDAWDAADAETEGVTREHVESWTDATSGSAAEARVAGGNGRTIYITAGDLSRIVREAIDALKAHGWPIYTRGGALVRPVRIEAAHDHGGVRRSPGAIVLGSVTSAWLRLRLAESATFERWYVRTGEWVPADPPREIADAVASVPDEGDWPELHAVVQCPVLWSDGAWTGVPGYTRGLLLDITPGWPEPGSTRDDAEAALETLRQHVRHFPWATATDEAAGLSLHITAVTRPVLDAAPMHNVDAPEAGTGKSLLVASASILATGTRAAVMDYGRDPVEAAKRLDSMLLAGDPIIAIDNVEAPLEGAALCQTLTEPYRRIRPLGSSERVTVPCTSFITATGNNLTIRGDLVRRSIVCRLDARTERPETRRIEQDIVAESCDRRAELVAACQTIVRAYIAAGRPSVGLAPLGNFGAWSATVRSALVWLGLPDPAGTIERTRADDPWRQEVHAILEAWHTVFGEQPATASEAVEQAAHDPALHEALTTVAARRGSIDTRALGYWLRRHRDARSGSLVLVLDGVYRGIRRWAVRGGDGGNGGDPHPLTREKSHNRDKVPNDAKHREGVGGIATMDTIATSDDICPACNGEGEPGCFCDGTGRIAR